MLFAMRVIATVLAAGLIATATISEFFHLSWFSHQSPQAISSASEASTKRQPNILFILTDDQDLELGSVDYTPLIRKHLKDRGTSFQNFFVTTTVCCPARVSLWTGRLAHNTNVTDVYPPWGW